MKVVRPNHVSKTFYIRLVFKKSVDTHFVKKKIIITIIYTITILLFVLIDIAVVTVYNIL